MHSHDMTRRLFLGSLGATLALPEFRGRAAGPAAAPTAANVEKDVVYGKGGDTDLHLDIYKPTGADNKRMAMIHFHGGGLPGGNKDGLAARLQAMSARGYIEYCRAVPAIGQRRREVAVANRRRKVVRSDGRARTRRGSASIPRESRLPAIGGRPPGALRRGNGESPGIRR